MFARVIPLVRTPLGVDGFDYHVPIGMTVRVGDLVLIPFRKKACPGLIAELLPTSLFADRALALEAAYAGLHLPETLPALITATAARTFSSPPTVAVSWLRALPKRPSPLTLVTKRSHAQGLHANWTTAATHALIAKANELALTSRVLIVTPWITLARQLQDNLPQSHILHSQLADGAAFREWTQFLSKETGCLITTKIGTWLALAADTVLLHEPEQDDHKQDELTPRYDARKILLWCAQQGLTAVHSYGLTPPLHANSAAPAIQGDVRIHFHHPQGRSAIALLQADTLQALLDHPGPRYVIHPIAGTIARLTCRDCHWQAVCPNCGGGLGLQTGQASCRSCRKSWPTPTACAVCQGVDLGKSLPGIERLRTQWNDHYPDTTIHWRTLVAEELEAPLASACLVVVTEAAWLGVGEDIRKSERQCLAVRRLADRVATKHGTLIFQTQGHFAPNITEWLTTAGMQHFVARTLEERQHFGYPPSRRVVKILCRGDQIVANAWRAQAETALRLAHIEPVDWRGPLVPERRSTTRSQQTLLHLVLPPHIPEALLVQTLTPLAAHVTLDIDPIAFLR